MQNITGETFRTSEQHKETTSARMAKDCEDIQNILQYLKGRNPFSTESPPSLQSIVSGVTANFSVNCDTASNVGHKVLELMKGQNVTQFTFPKKT